MSADYAYLRHWLTREGYGKDTDPGIVILECVPSRSGMSMTVYDRGEALFRVNGCGFDRGGTALGTVLETLFRPELMAWGRPQSSEALARQAVRISRKGDYILTGEAGQESMRGIAEAIGLNVHFSESKAGTLIVLTAKPNAQVIKSEA